MKAFTAKGNVGAPVLRVEDERILMGNAKYIDDLPEPAGTVFLAFLRSPYPHARIRSLDLSAAKAATGVLAVFAGADIAEATNPMESPTMPDLPKLVRPNMAIDVTRYVGEAVAVVVARDAYLAEDALELIEVDYDPLPPVITVDDALAEDAPLVHDYIRTNVIFTSRGAVPSREAVDDVFARAPHVIGDTFKSGRISAVAMEMRGFLTSFDKGKGTLQHISTAHLPHKMRWELADTLGIPEKDVTVVAPQVGGSFGLKCVTRSEDVVGAVISRKLQRPVKWLQDRQDDLAVMHGNDFQFGVEIACDNEGKLLGVRTKVYVNIGAYPLWIATSGLEAAGQAHHMMGPYKVENYSYDASTVVSHKAPTASFRGVSAPFNMLAMETLLERMADEVGIDPIEIRRRNLIRDEDLPYKNAVGVIHDTASHIVCLDKALDMIGYDRFKQTMSGKLGEDGKYRGIGIATITDHTGQGTSIARSRGQASRWPGFDGATIKMEPDGKVVAYISLASQGQGHQTVFAQIIADQLGMLLEDITVEQGDTSTMPFGTGAGASRGAVAGGGAVFKACVSVASKLKRIAAHMLEVSVDDVVLENSKASARGSNRFIDFSELAATAYMIVPGDLPPGETIGIEAKEFYDPPTSSYSNATHGVQLAVEADTGIVTIEQYVVVHDCGRVLNPMIVDGQVTGAIVQGVGLVLTEAMRYSEEGQPISTTLLDYGIPTFLDAPLVRLDHVETPSTTNPLGLKGAGEGGVVGAIPAIALALKDALSAFRPNFNEVPIMPDHLLEIIHP